MSTPSRGSRCVRSSSACSWERSESRSSRVEVGGEQTPVVALFARMRAGAYFENGGVAALNHAPGVLQVTFQARQFSLLRLYAGFVGRRFLKRRKFYMGMKALHLHEGDADA